MSEATRRGAAILAAERRERLERERAERDAEQARFEREWLAPPTVAELLKVTTLTLKRWRMRGIGPPFTKFGPSAQSRVRYSAAELRRYMRDPTAAPADAAAS